MIKKYMLFICLFGVFAALNVHAQRWEWGRINTGLLEGWPVATDPSGNVFVAGYVPTAGTYQSVISKYNSSGDLLWTKGTANGDAFVINIATDREGNSLLFGYFGSHNLQIDSISLTNAIAPQSQYFLAKFDSSGTVMWVKNSGNTQYEQAVVGNPYFYTFVFGPGGIAIDTMNNIYITANFHLSSMTIGAYTLTNTDTTGYTDDIFIAKYDPLGNVVWATSAGGSGSDDAYGLTVTPEGNIYIAGVFCSPTIKFGTSTIANSGGDTGNAFIAEYNASGTPVWASGSGGHGGEFATGVASDASNNVYLTGGLSDNSITFNGTAITNPYPGDIVLYLVKFDRANNVSWFKTIGSPKGGRAWGYSIAMSPCGAIWVNGSFSDEVNIDGNILNAPLVSAIPPFVDDPVFIAGFSIDGVYAGSAALQSGADDQSGIACDAFGNVYVCADFRTFPFTIGNDTFANITSGNEWLYIAKYEFVNSLHPDTFITKSDTTVCFGSRIILAAPQGYLRYLWNDGSNAETLPIDIAGTYWVIGSGGCTVIDSFAVRENPSLCSCNTVLPSAFTPNNDGKDDYYQPIFSSDCVISNYSFAIYNRWGARVFYSQNMNDKWDGNYLGMKAELGVYMYYLEYKSINTGTMQHFKGDITLIR